MFFIAKTTSYFYCNWRSRTDTSFEKGKNVAADEDAALHWRIFEMILVNSGYHIESVNVIQVCWLQDVEIYSKSSWNGAGKYLSVELEYNVGILSPSYCKFSVTTNIKVYIYVLQKPFVVTNLRLNALKNKRKLFF